LKRILEIGQWPIDLLILVFAVPSAYVLLAYRSAGSGRLPLTTRILKKIGLFPIRRHYYEPLFDDSCLSRPLSEDRELPGIDLNVAEQQAFLAKLRFSQELVDLKLDQPSADPFKFYLKNPNFGCGDAEYLYQFLRATQPGKVIEIGSGHSTKITRMALNRNYAESTLKAEHICIEPHEMNWLEQMEGVTILRKRVEDCGLDWATELSSGDLLFIDSSHMIRPQGDVLKEYLEILPRLSSGVYVHMHDIFTPKDYLRLWVVDQVRFWNEQYLLEALLSNSSRYEVVGAVNYLKHHNFDSFQRVCPYLKKENEPGSFYIRVR
jgi:hypothetical protein